MSGNLVDCEHCKGHGKVHCRCKDRPLKILQSDTSIAGVHLIGQYIGRCRICGQLWKVYGHVHAGEGSGAVWLKPGHEQSGYTFPFAEAAPHLEPGDLLLLPYVELLKHVPLDKLIEYRQELEEKHPGLDMAG